MTAYRNGLLAESWVALVLQLKGYRILSRRLRTPGGEIDLLAKRGQTLALVEVKLRPSLAEAAGAISNRQQSRLQTAARFVLAQRPDLCHHDVRFDAVLVNRFGGLRHITNAWSHA